ncbi:ketopantoate reductase family protein [Sedimentitalea todarodis]|uniref:2-dehydropantoate 2-reductase n=1 Tax=Sedimentitalea todarodis TaxID=1631240 RepID=A0ABU3VA23_9RHOB|nr:2-dehydropantoate 2-reductase [Sedimentitalea todarodis]MDU9003020.1 2-dehydropantoate 2-reductase [Sedimentitalea todarodis]
MKIATMATGGIGGFLAVRLTQAGHQVATIARGAHLEAIRERGLTLNGPDEGDDSVTVTPWVATDIPEQVGPVDAVIFGVKGDALESAAKACLPMIGPDTVVVPFLNGVEASNRLLAILPEACVANGVAHVSTTIAEPGIIDQVGTFNRFVFAERDNRPSARIDALRSAINAAGSSAPATDDVDRDLWMKFIMFSGASGITAAARCIIGDILDNPPLGNLFRAVVAETTALGRARGISLPTTIEDDTWAIVQNLPRDMRASTAIDLEAGRPLEIEWISGAVRRLAQDSDVPAPINAALYALLLPHRSGQGG